MENKIKELRDFYLLDGKLLYVSKDFIGFDPIIGKGLSYERNKKENTTIKLDKFKIGETSFNVVLTSFMDWGPLRGYHRAEILKNGYSIINYEHGGMGHGSNYCKGDYFHKENKDAFLLKNGYALKDRLSDKIYLDLNGNNDYLFWFKNIVIPTKGKNWPADGRALENNRSYICAEIESLRQIQWEANVNFSNHHIYIKKTAVPYCSLVYWRSADDYQIYRKDSWQTALDKIELIFI
ncbi:MAG: hypothetical protein Q7K35_00950 [bacterium]|nr:hypothetical protein [bacterium]